MIAAKAPRSRPRALFARRPEIIRPPEPPAVPGPPLARYLTLGGAVVEVRPHEYRVHYGSCWCTRAFRDPAPLAGVHERRPHESRDASGYRAECTGCGETLGGPFDRKEEAGKRANEHAGNCRAMP